MSAEDIAVAFVNHFYSTLGSNPAALAGLYVSATNLCYSLPSDLTYRMLLATTIYFNF